MRAVGWIQEQREAQCAEGGEQGLAMSGTHCSHGTITMHASTFQTQTKSE